MNQFNYKKPPITEAVIGVNFTNPVDEKKLATANKKFSSLYPQFEPLTNVSFEFQFEPDSPAQKTKVTPVSSGFKRSNPDSTELLMLWPTHIVMSHLAPYQGWDYFFEKFKKSWAIWKYSIGFHQISRIGVRYINRIDIPFDQGKIIDFQKYLNIYTSVPFAVPLESYTLQASLPIKEIECVVNINSATVPSPLLNHLSFILDLDIYKELNAPQSDEDMFNLITKIREHKNFIFESCITDLSRDLFNRG